MRWLIALLPVALGIAGCGPGVGNSCTLAAPGWRMPSGGYPAFITMAVVSFSDAGLLWNGKMVSADELDALVLAGRQMNPAPALILDNSAAPDCKAALRVMRRIDDLAHCGSAAFCGLGSVQDWQHATPMRDTL